MRKIFFASLFLLSCATTPETKVVKEWCGCDIACVFKDGTVIMGHGTILTKDACGNPTEECVTRPIVCE